MAFEASLLKHGRIQGEKENGRRESSSVREKHTSQGREGRKPGLAGTERAGEGNRLDRKARANLWRGLKVCKGARAFSLRNLGPWPCCSVVQHCLIHRKVMGSTPVREHA